MKASWGVHDLDPAVALTAYASGAADQGLVRLERLVVMPALAIGGEPSCTFAVLEAPATGAWFGEDPGGAGSALIRLDRSRVAPATPAAEAALGETAEVYRTTRDRLAATAASQFDERFRARAIKTALGLPRPDPDALAIDLGRAALGQVPPPATWTKLIDGVHLTSVGSDDPLGWIEEWTSREEFLAADDRDAQVAVACLARWVRGGRGRHPASVEAGARKAALAHLASVAPDLATIAADLAS